MGIAFHGGAIGFDRGCGVSGNESVITAQVVAIVGVAGVKVRGALQAGEFGPFSQQSCDKKAPRQEKVEQAKKCRNTNG
jgi:hypothetical protein